MEHNLGTDRRAWTPPSSGTGATFRPARRPIVHGGFPRGLVPMTPAPVDRATMIDAATDAPGDDRVTRGFAALLANERTKRHLVSVPECSPGAIRVVLADDDDAIRDVLRAMIEAAEGIVLVGMAADAAEAVRLASLHRPDVAVVDVRMPGGGSNAAHEMAWRSPTTRVIALTAHDDRMSVREMIAEGVTSYLTKDEPIEEIVAAIRDAAAGKTRLSPTVRSHVVAELGTRLGGERRASSERGEKERRIRRILARGEGLRMVYQPIVNLRSGRTIGVEALARFTQDPPRPPDAWFAEAADVGAGVELELLALRLALRALDRIPDDVFVSVNVGPATILEPALAANLAGAPTGRIVVEVTEHVPMHDGPGVRAALARLRRTGVRIAVDDAGAGSANLRHILRLDPDLIKLDMSLIRDIHREPMSRALVAALVAFADQVDVDLVAEGVETAEEVEALDELGVRYVQGFFVGRPGPLPEPFVDPWTGPPVTGSASGTSD